MDWLSNITAIINKLLPGRKEAYVDELNKLNVLYQECLRKGHDTQASILRKRMHKLREKLGFSNEEL